MYRENTPSASVIIVINIVVIYLVNKRCYNIKHCSRFLLPNYINCLTSTVICYYTACLITSLREINCILKKIVATKDEFGRNSTRGDDLIIGPRVTWNEMRFVDKSMEFLSHVRVQRFVIDMLFLIQHHIFFFVSFIPTGKKVVQRLL